MRKKYIGYLLLVVIGVVLAVGIYAVTHKKPPVGPGATEGIAISPEDKSSALYREIQEISGEYKIEPIDAAVDRVWKAIPGYNGLEVDIDASYRAMQSDGLFDRDKIVLKEISPRVHLEDLDPEPIYRGNPEKPMVAFLINVAWGDEYIPGILESLDKHQVKATFFFDGSWTKKSPDLAREIHEGGHEIGNHAYSHPDLQRYSREETREEIRKTNEVIEETLGVKPIWFAPPSGSFNEATVQVADELGMKTILWTVDTVDWRKPATQEMVSRVVSQVENGSMILMHPTQPTAEGIDAMITGIREKGYLLDTVSSLMDEKRVRLE